MKTKFENFLKDNSVYDEFVTNMVSHYRNTLTFDEWFETVVDKRKLVEAAFDWDVDGKGKPSVIHKWSTIHTNWLKVIA